MIQIAKGWFGESRRHSLASRGIRTSPLQKQNARLGWWAGWFASLPFEGLSNKAFNRRLARYPYGTDKDDDNVPDEFDLDVGDD